MFSFVWRIAAASLVGWLLFGALFGFGFWLAQSLGRQPDKMTWLFGYVAVCVLITAWLIREFTSE